MRKLIALISRMTRSLVPVVLLAAALPLLHASAAPVDVLTWQVDQSNSGVNRREIVLTPANVKVTTFGKLFTVAVDGQVFTQPLLKTKVLIETAAYRGVHDVVYVATEHDSLYAIDAHDGTVLWQDSFIDPDSGITTPSPHELESDTNIAYEIGITGTPVIDKRTNTLFVSAETREVEGGQVHYVQRLHAIDIGSGRERQGSPVVVADTSFSNWQYTYYAGPSVKGYGDGNVNGVLTFNAMRQNQRPALEIVNGTVYVAYSSHDDIGPYHGWVLGFRESDLRLDAVFCDTPNGGLGGIWGAAGKPAVDENGDLYFSTGNGSFDPELNANGQPKNFDYGNSIVKLAVDPTTTAANPGPNGWGLKVADFFTPSDFQYQNDRDGDIGSGGICLLPSAMGSAAHQHLLLTGGKDYRLYLLDRNNMTGFHTDHDYVIQEINGAINRLFACPNAFDGSVYFASDSAQMMQFTINSAAMSPHPVNVTPNSYGFPGSTPFISANGDSNAILWALNRYGDQLEAYDLANFPKQIYSSNDASADAIGRVIRFTIPTVANGLVYVGTDNNLSCYGLLPTVRTPDQIHAAAPQSIDPPVTPTNANGVAAGSEVDLTWVNHADNATNYKILRKTGTSGTYTTLAVLPPTAVSYRDTYQIAPHTDYEYHVIAVNAAGNSDFAGFVAHVP